MWNEILDKLFTVGEECGDENWNFNGEDRITPAVLLNAIKVIRKLGVGIDPSCIKPMWDGRVSLSFKSGETMYQIIVSQFHAQCVTVKNPGNIFDQKFLEMDNECLEKLKSFFGN